MNGLDQIRILNGTTLKSKAEETPTSIKEALMPSHICYQNALVEDQHHEKYST